MGSETTRAGQQIVRPEYVYGRWPAGLGYLVDDALDEDDAGGAP
jgi:hypothetical protein